MLEPGDPVPVAAMETLPITSSCADVSRARNTSP